MILRCNYEELRALRVGARAVLGVGEAGGAQTVAAPTVDRAPVEALMPRLEGDLTVETLQELRAVLSGVGCIVECLQGELVTEVIATHPADEVAVAAYFDYAHALAVLGRIRDMESEMVALIEVVTGGPVTDEVASTFAFPD